MKLHSFACTLCRGLYVGGQVSKYILRPQLLAEIGTNHDAIRRMWPAEASTPPFLDFIRKQYDPTQSAAIEACPQFLPLPLPALPLPLPLFCPALPCPEASSFL